ncbi:MAG: hypothetical protein HY807_02480 [Nitrospirae bacterium]|nr:hypothetical protein [Nitrospirota bacterium]
MKNLKLLLVVAVIAGLVFIYETSRAEDVPGYGTSGHVEKIGDAAKGKVLFNDPKLGNGTTGKSCNSCHPNGRNLEHAGEKTAFNIMGKKQGSLEEAVNICIEMPLKGKAIDPKGQDMKDIVSYIKSLKK